MSRLLKENEPKDTLTPVTLGDLTTMSIGMKDADFWIEIRGSRKTVGRPTNEYGPYRLGIKVTATDILNPKFLYYAFEHLYNQGLLARLATGTTELVNIRKSDIQRIPMTKAI